MTMKKLSLLTLLIFLTFLPDTTFTQTTCQNNLLTNPGFESGLTGWTTVGNVTVTADAHSGSKAVLANSGTYASAGQTIPATPGKTYTISAWAKGNFVFELRFMNASWQKLPGGNAFGYSPVDYQAVSITASAPAGTVYAYLFVYKDYNYTFSLDDACLSEETTAPCLITAGVSSVLCKDNGTPTNPNDDLFDFTVMAGNPTAGTGYKLVIPALNQVYSGTYGALLTVQNVPVSTGIISMTITDNISTACFAFISVTAPAPCSGTGLPDLIGSSSEIILSGNCYLIPGQLPGIFLMQINNGGSVPATAFKVKFYLSTDNTLSATDLLWSTVNVPLLGPTPSNMPAFVSPNQPVPTTLANGNYFVLVTIDEENQVVESNETNNSIGPIQVQIGAPDVSLENYTGLPSTVAAGSSFPMQVTMKFLSNGINLPANTSMSVSVSIEGPNPIIIGTVNYDISDFSQSNTVTKTLQVNVPSTLVAGTYTFRVMASMGVCETINQGNFQEKVVTVATGGGNGQIDLELSMVQNTANPVIYSNYTTTLILVNKGPQAATGVRVKWAKPAGVVYTGGNEFVTSQGSFNPNGDQVWTVGSVPANGTATLTVSYFLLQNGAPVTYAQVTAANETDSDSQPNNGTPPAPNQDDEAASGGSEPPVLTPDLAISNLVVENAPVQPGQILNYHFNLANIGNGPAPMDFVVKAYISIYPTFSINSSIQDGIVPTGNYPAGFSVAGIPGSSTIPSTLPDGQYYLHLWMDADQVVTELSESNNFISATFMVQGTLQPGECDKLIGAGAISCLTNNSLGQLEIIYSTGNNLSKALLDGTGQVVSNQSFGTTSPIIEYFIEDDMLKKKVDNVLVYAHAIPPAILNQYDEILDFTEFNNGYVIIALKYSENKLFGIRTDANIGVQQEASLSGNFSGAATNYVSDLMQVSSGNVAFTLRSSYFSSFFFVLNQNMETTQFIGLSPGGSAGGSAYLAKAGCDKYILSYTIDGLCLFGRCYETSKAMGHFENGLFVVDRTKWYREQSSMGIGTFYQKWSVPTPDGGVISGSNSQPLPAYAYPPSNSIHLEKLVNNAVVWTKDIGVASVGSIQWLAFSGNELVFLSEKVNAIFVEALNCLETPTPPTGCNAIAITPGSGQITIAGFSAPHVLIKVFRPNWTVAYECLDNCANPLTVTGLSTGTHHLQIKLINSGWGEICYLEQDVNVTSFGGGMPLKFTNDRQRLTFDRIYPIPAKYFVTMDVYSREVQPAVLQFYDATGRLVHSMKVNLEEGPNEIWLDVSDWKSGAYNVIGLGNGLPAYGRLLKVWEE